MEAMPLLMGQAAGAVNDIRPAKDIIDDMVSEAIGILRGINAK
jgi:NAD(P)H-dependent flavin oxidoreductase YrpB (nitropropane dioxygenase family)